MEATHDLDFVLWCLEPSRPVRVYSQNNFGAMQEASGAPIPISNVHWTATVAVISGVGSASVSSGQNLSTTDTLVAFGLEGNKSPCTIQVTFNLTINNSWTYDADTYLQNLVLTATAQ